MNIFNSSWSLAKGWVQEKPLLVRYRQLSDERQREHWPVRLNVFWRMTKCADNGLPTEEEASRLDLFEDRLVAAVESDQSALLSVVLTCEGQREFVFHAKNAKDFVDRLCAMPQEAARYPIEIQKYDDPEWKYDQLVTAQFVGGSLQ